MGAILQHAEALAQHEAERQALVVVLLRDDAVEARLGEEAGPAIERAAVDDLAVLGVEILELVAQRNQGQSLFFIGP
jgi:hypothetical protein